MASIRSHGGAGVAQPMPMAPAGVGFFGAAAAPHLANHQARSFLLGGGGVPQVHYNPGFQDQQRLLGRRRDPSTNQPLFQDEIEVTRRASGGVIDNPFEGPAELDLGGLLDQLLGRRSRN